MPQTPTTIEADLALDAHARLGEGPIWDAEGGRLVWVDIHAEAVHLFDPSSGFDQVLQAGQHVGAAAVRSRGGLILAARDGFVLLDPATGAIEPFVAVKEDPSTRFNDGKCDAAGRFWAGTMAYAFTPGAGSFYRLDPDGSVTAMFGDVAVSNGLGWSPDWRTMYYIDTPTRGVDAFDFDLAAGTIANRRRAVEIPREAGGLPDGMCVDAEGCLWVAIVRSGSVQRYTPDGRLDRTVRLPTSGVTSCCFGGADLGDLYITTSAELVPEDQRTAQPHAGGLFICRPGVGGQPPCTFGG